MSQLNNYHRMLFKSALMVAVLCNISCARLTSIYRSENVPTDKPHIVSIDVKQRALLTSPNRQEGAKVDLRFCAEPPPDVFTALAASLGAEASVSKGTAADTAMAAKLATSLSENASTIERSQTVNILREAMYRNCERYLSGAIEESEFIIQAARDQQMIVQVLAIEQITGAARAQATALTTIAKSAASGVTDTGLEILAGAKKDLDTKRGASDKAMAAAVALPPAGACGQSPIDTATLPAGTTAAQADAKNAKCAEAKAAAGLTKEAQDYLATVQDAVTRQSEVSSTAQGALASNAHSAAAVSEAIAKQVVRIVEVNHAFDEIGMTCVVWLRQKAPNANLPEYCSELLKQMAKTYSAGLFLAEMAKTRQAEDLVAQGFDLDAIESNLTRLQAVTATHANAVWNHLGAGTKVTRESLILLADQAGVRIPTVRLDALIAAGNNLAAFTMEFGRLAQSVQEKLADASK
jgi:hypothetical protein